MKIRRNYILLNISFLYILLRTGKEHIFGSKVVSNCRLGGNQRQEIGLYSSRQSTGSALRLTGSGSMPQEQPDPGLNLEEKRARIQMKNWIRIWLNVKKTNLFFIINIWWTKILNIIWKKKYVFVSYTGYLIRILKPDPI